MNSSWAAGLDKIRSDDWGLSYIPLHLPEQLSSQAVLLGPSWAGRGRKDAWAEQVWSADRCGGLEGPTSVRSPHCAQPR